MNRQSAALRPTVVCDEPKSRRRGRRDAVPAAYWDSERTAGGGGGRLASPRCGASGGGRASVPWARGAGPWRAGPAYGGRGFGLVLFCPLASLLWMFVAPLCVCGVLMCLCVCFFDVWFFYCCCVYLFCFIMIFFILWLNFIWFFFKYIHTFFYRFWKYFRN